MRLAHKMVIYFSSSSIEKVSKERLLCCTEKNLSRKIRKKQSKHDYYNLSSPKGFISKRGFCWRFVCEVRDVTHLEMIRKQYSVTSHLNEPCRHVFRCSRYRQIRRKNAGKNAGKKQSQPHCPYRLLLLKANENENLQLEIQTTLGRLFYTGMHNHSTGISKKKINEQVRANKLKDDTEIMVIDDEKMIIDKKESGVVETSNESSEKVIKLFLIQIHTMVDCRTLKEYKEHLKIVDF